MNAIPSGLVDRETEAEGVHETQDGLVEMGAVSQTKGWPLGHTPDGGGGFVFAGDEPL